MTRAHSVRVAVPLLAAVVAAAALPGCAQNGPMLSHQANLSTLKTSVSHLEFENQQLRHEVANLKAENRDFEDRLVQEESHNGELSARLDDARNLLSQRGGGPLESPGSADLDSPRKTLPAGRTTRKGRKPPFAQIPGRVDDLPRNEKDDADDPAFRSGWRKDQNTRAAQADPTVWLPVARGASETPRR